jgi:hypothetical protein
MAAPALAKLSPALRFGPVLRDPKVAQVPVPSDVRGNWTWHHRPDPTSWTSEHRWLSVTLIPDTAYKQTAVQLRVTHVRREPDHSLAAIGGTNPDGTPLLLPVPQAAGFLESGRFAFCVQEPGYQRRDLQVVHREGSKYLRTPHDPYPQNNLSALPEAPADW